MTPDETLGKEVLRMVMQLGVSSEELSHLIDTIKGYYEITSVRFLLGWALIRPDPYQHRMMNKPDNVGADEFIGHACNTQGNSLSAFERYYRTGIGGSNRVFRLLLGAMLHKVDRRCNFFLDPVTALAYRVEFKRAMLPIQNKTESKKSSDATELNIDKKKEIDDYTQNYKSKKSRRVMFLGLAQKVAHSFRVVPTRLSVTAHGRAYTEGNVGQSEGAAPISDSALYSAIRESFRTYKHNYFSDPDKWESRDKMDFRNAVEGNRLVANTHIMGDEVANPRDADEADDLDSESLMNVFITPDQFEKKIDRELEEREYIGTPSSPKPSKPAAPT